MARISKPPVPATMYRNFAAVTICVTASLAILADGEKRGAQAAEPNYSKKSVHEAPFEAPPGADFIVAEDFAGSDHRMEFVSDFGRPTVRVTSSSSALRIRHAQSGSGPDGRLIAPSGYGMGGLTDEQLARMTDAERAALEELVRGDRAPSSAEQKRQASSLRQASLARSGAKATDDF